ncbi:Putative NAD(P)H nitroreductase acg [Stieleria neptunia]|uniref:NAD(P)H nitroreductase acg n=1 Tax=Stieleria neptunia TaxID=2527979 RepID=A0A518HR54_9BACT|nr:hypothetical protein [Stieleria neptunia]QDV43268.1 Putative NAD(P)H nitroreductase acg [Stieleria neptunia]
MPPIDSPLTHQPAPHLAATGAEDALGNKDAAATVSAAQTLATRVYREAIQAGCAAPSADNNQPWLFRATEAGLSIYCDLTRRLPSDVDGMFDLLSLGAVVENIAQWIASAGYGTAVSLKGASDFAAADGSPSQIHVATVRIVDDQPSDNVDLADFIWDRHTNRYPFSPVCLTSEELDQVSSVLADTAELRVKWINERPLINRCANLVALSDSLRFRYQDFHEELHRQLRLSVAEADRTRDGLDYRTLGLPPGSKHFLRAIKPWRRMQMLNRLGMARALSLPSIPLIRNSGAIGFLYVKDRSPHSLLCGGRAMQRIWLQATKLGLAIHPLGSLPIFTANDSLPAELRVIADQIKTRSEGLIPPDDGFFQMAFRIGHPRRGVPIRSQRRDAKDVMLDSKNNNGSGQN